MAVDEGSMWVSLIFLCFELCLQNLAVLVLLDLGEDPFAESLALALSYPFLDNGVILYSGADSCACC